MKLNMSIAMVHNPLHSSFLEQMPFFGGIRPSIIELILSHSSPLAKAAEEYFFIENEIANSMFLLTDGEVEIIKAYNHKNYQLSHLIAGDCFGEMAIIEHNIRSASVKALTNCTAIEISNDCLGEVYLADIKQFALLQMNMSREVSRRLREANELLFRAQIENEMYSKKLAATKLA